MKKLALLLALVLIVSMSHALPSPNLLQYCQHGADTFPPSVDKRPKLSYNEQNLGSQVSFWASSVAPYLSDAKTAIVSACHTINHPHYLESYYLLATKLS